MRDFTDIEMGRLLSELESIRDTAEQGLKHLDKKVGLKERTANALFVICAMAGQFKHFQERVGNILKEIHPEKKGFDPYQGVNENAPWRGAQ